MSEILMCEASELFNLLNQTRSGSRLAEINYLSLIDARESEDYNWSHIITAKNIKLDSEGNFLLPVCVEVDSMQHVVVYDDNSSSLQEQGRAVQCAQVLAAVSQNPVLIVRGGFQRFATLYNFLRTEKIIHTTLELENMKTYPVEIVSGLLFMGDQRQGSDQIVLRDLKIRAVVNVSHDDALESRFIKGNQSIQSILNVSAVDSATSDLYLSFQKICAFIDSNIDVGSRVLIVSPRGRSRCSAVAIAFLIHHLRYTLEEAWKHVIRCKHNMRPNTGFLQQLSDWEGNVRGTRLTDVTGF